MFSLYIVNIEYQLVFINRTLKLLKYVLNIEITIDLSVCHGPIDSFYWQFPASWRACIFEIYFEASHKHFYSFTSFVMINYPRFSPKTLIFSTNWTAPTVLDSKQTHS